MHLWKKYFSQFFCEKNPVRISDYGMSYFFYATYPPCPILSDFAWPPQPPLKTGIIYVRSLTQNTSWHWWLCNVWTKKNMISDLSIFIRVIDILNFSQTFCRLMIHDDLFFFLFGKSEPIMISSYKCSILLGLDKAKQRFFPAWNWNCK